MVGGYSGLPIGNQPRKTLIARRRSRSFSYVLSQEWRFGNAPATAICRNSQIFDAADVVDLPGLIPPGDQAQIGADVSGSADARRRRSQLQREERSFGLRLEFGLRAALWGPGGFRGSNLSWARGSSASSTGVGYDCSRRLSIPRSSQSVEDHGDVDDLLEEGSLDRGDVTKGCCDHASD